MSVKRRAQSLWCLVIKSESGRMETEVSIEAIEMENGGDWGE